MTCASPFLPIISNFYKDLGWAACLRLKIPVGIASFGITKGSGLFITVGIPMLCLITWSSSLAEVPTTLHAAEERVRHVSNLPEGCSCDLLKSPDCIPTTWECYGSFEKGTIFEYDHVLRCEKSVKPDGTTECIKVAEKRTVQCGVFTTEKECKDGGIIKEVKLPLECDATCRIAEQPRWIPCDQAKKIPGKEGFEDVLSECEQCSDPGSCDKSYCFGVRLDPDNSCKPALDPAIAVCTWGPGRDLNQVDSWTPATSAAGDYD